MTERLVLGLVSIAALLIFAATSLADPNLENVPAHRHWIATPARMVEVGPRLCDNPSLQAAFNQFHNNVHVVTPSSIGPAAPGLHNFTGAELTFTQC
jgi:hypothetical protein